MNITRRDFLKGFGASLIVAVSAPRLLANGWNEVYCPPFDVTMYPEEYQAMLQSFAHHIRPRFIQEHRLVDNPFGFNKIFQCLVIEQGNKKAMGLAVEVMPYADAKAFGLEGASQIERAFSKNV